MDINVVTETLGFGFNRYNRGMDVVNLFDIVSNFHSNPISAYGH